MTMTQDKDPNATALEALFAAERADVPVPSEAFMARINADARRVQHGFAEAPTVAVPRRTLWPQWSAMAGLAACLVLGVGLGGGFSLQVGAVADTYLAGGEFAAFEIFAGPLDYIALLEEG
jgi:hypothetical protein